MHSYWKEYSIILLAKIAVTHPISCINITHKLKTMSYNFPKEISIRFVTFRNMESY